MAGLPLTSIFAFHDFEICRSILESLPIGLCVIDVQKRIVFWSDGAARITGHPRHEVIGRLYNSDSSLSCDRPGCEFCRDDFPLTRAIKAARPTESIGFLHHKSGHGITIRARSVPVRNPHGSIIGAVAIFEDQHEPTAAGQDDDDRRSHSCVDETTSVASRTMMQSYLKETLAAFRDAEVSFGILCIRVEQLEQFRATCGSDASSSLLRVIARGLEAALWKTDSIGRWSDDQFLVILNGCLEEDIYSVRERVRRLLANDAIEWWGERRSLSLSIGQATALPGDTVDSLLDRAHKSLAAAAGSNPFAAATLTNPFCRS
jgi:diguanylate cyclase (GGDEF)-like protein/PAS domain S-box-containing protein